MGANFEEYMNYGQAGACNTFIMNRFMEVNFNLNLNLNDYVVIMFTNIDRFSFRNKNKWVHGGNIYFNSHIPKGFTEDVWSDEWSVYKTYITIKTIKEILTLKGIKHTFLTSIDNSFLLNTLKDNKLITKYSNDITNLLDIKQPMDNWRRKNYSDVLQYVKYNDKTKYDMHPTQTMHYEYLKEVFPEYDTIESKERYELSLNAVNTDSTTLQEYEYQRKILMPFNKAHLENSKLFF
jgi:hypothetical protein